MYGTLQLTDMNWRHNTNAVPLISLNANGATLLASGTASNFTKTSGLIVPANVSARIGTAAASDRLTLGAALNAATATSVVNFTGPGTVVVGGDSVGQLFTTNITGGTVVLNTTAVRPFGGTATVSSSPTVNISGGNLILQTSTNTTLGSYTYAMTGGTLTFASGIAAYTNSQNVTLNGDATFVSDRPTAGAGVTYTVSTITSPTGFNTNGNVTLTVLAGDNVTSGTAGIAFTTSTLGGITTFNIINNRPNVTTLFSASSTLNGTTGGIIKNGAGTLVLGSANNTLYGDTIVNDGVLSFTALDYTLGLPLNGKLTMNGGTLQINVTGYATAHDIELNALAGFDAVGSFAPIVSGRISGTGGINKIGTGTLVLSGIANTFTGGAIVTAGNLQLAADANLGTVPTTPAVNLTLGGGRLQYASDFALNPNRTISLTAAVTNTIDTNGFSPTIAGDIVGTGALTKAGVGTLYLTSATSGYSGGTIVGAGTLNIAADGALGAVPDAPETNLTLSSTLQFGAAGITLHANRTILLQTSSAGNFDTSGFSAAIAGRIAGSGSLYKRNEGTLTLTAANDYTGTTFIQRGSLVGTARATGSPFGATSQFTLLGGGLRIDGISVPTTTVQTGILAVGGESIGGGAKLIVNRGAVGRVDDDSVRVARPQHRPRHAGRRTSERQSRCR
ncbi:MAG: autotransporter-associated beta strand repeat-containing protein [Pirellulales bacterium]